MRSACPNRFILDAQARRYVEIRTVGFDFKLREGILASQGSKIALPIEFRAKENIAPRGGIVDANAPGARLLEVILRQSLTRRPNPNSIIGRYNSQSHAYVHPGRCSHCVVRPNPPGAGRNLLARQSRCSLLPRPGL